VFLEKNLQYNLLKALLSVKWYSPILLDVIYTTMHSNDGPLNEIIQWVLGGALALIQASAKRWYETAEACMYTLCGCIHTHLSLISPAGNPEKCSHVQQ
jgi:hypothetical protein